MLRQSGVSFQRARGKWRSVLTSLGVGASILNGRNQACPMCGGHDRFRFTDKNGDGLYVCSQCGPGNGISLLMNLQGLSYSEAANKIDGVVGSAKEAPRDEKSTLERNRAALNQTWNAARPITLDDPAGRYLRGRTGIVSFPACLRFLDRARYRVDSGEAIYMPCLLAKVTDPDGRPSTIHRTYLTDDGRKAAVPEPRRLMPGEVAAGASIKLASHSGSLGVAEGIETALSVTALSGIPCWATIAANYLRSWKSPGNVSHIFIFGDNDLNFSGQSAAYELARRLRIDKSGPLSVRVSLPKVAGYDWNDIWRDNQQAAKAA